MRGGWFASGCMMFAVACQGGGNGKEETGGSGSDDSGGGGGGQDWRASGEGYAYFLDGTLDNSVLVLDLTRCIAPKEGESYWGWLTKGGADPVSVGAIPCVNEEVAFEGEVGVDVLLDGYDTFDAYASAEESMDGTHLWHGAVDSTLLGIVQGL